MSSPPTQTIVGVFSAFDKCSDFTIQMSGSSAAMNASPGLGCISVSKPLTTFAIAELGLNKMACWPPPFGFIL